MSRSYGRLASAVLACALAAGCTANMDSGSALDDSQLEIIGGTEDHGDPAVVRLHGVDDQPQNQVFCTGTLIAPRLVVTAAHCLGKPNEHGEVLVRRIGWMGFGLHGDASPLPVVQEIVHPKWTGNVNNGFDVGLVVLAEPVTNVAPVALSTDHADASEGEEIRIVGFGNNVSDPNEKEWGTGFGTKRTATMTAAQGVSTPEAGSLIAALGEQGEQACLGDSGGPVFYVDADGVERIVGITSSARRGCYDTGSQHGRVSFFAAWIDQQRKQLEQPSAQPSEAL